MDFRTACMNNDLALAKTMWAKNSMRAVDMDLIFLETVACGSRRLAMAKWLVSLGVVNVNAYNGYAFVAACANNHKETAQWLLSRDVFPVSTIQRALKLCSAELMPWRL